MRETKFYNPNDDTEQKSRSQKKRESTAVQQEGAALAALPMEKLKTLGLSDELLQAILDWKKFSGHEAKRRQMQYIGRLMRESAEDVSE